MYQIQNPINQAMGGMAQASGTYGRVMPNIPANQKPKPTVGGAMMNGAGGAVMGAQAGTMIGSAMTANATAAGATAAEAAAAGASAGPWGMAAGALIGIGAYLFS
ncbi:MAG: hypothetical protein KKF12_11990 [Proteobacteria bacterium]|nr:hypothetical protein [Desulfobacula sp.]MBU3951547.1 hypothetical protein [Pseudomonadota bacterium]MBU4131533.1 hypothetical protein [Pseudomonadota bacterium]